MIASTTKRLPADLRRRSILDAALVVLSKQGYSGMTTARIAGRVGVSEPILYRHFSSKRAILRALLDEVIVRMTGAMAELIAGETDSVAALRRVCRAYPELSRRYGREFRIINRTLVEAGDRETTEALTRHYDAYRSVLQKLIEKGQGSGALRRDIPASVGAWHLIHSALGYLMTEDVRMDVRSTRDLDGLADVALAGLLEAP